MWTASSARALHLLSPSPLPPPHPQNADAILAHPHPEALIETRHGRRQGSCAHVGVGTSRKTRDTPSCVPHPSQDRTALCTVPPTFRLTRSVLRAYRPKAPIPTSYAASPSACGTHARRRAVRARAHALEVPGSAREAEAGSTRGDVDGMGWDVMLAPGASAAGRGAMDVRAPRET
jgi:hypothetical protein